MLNVIAAGLNKGTPFKNFIVNGLVLRGDNKWHKKFYVDPMQICEKYGADAIRLYFLGSPLVIG